MDYHSPSQAPPAVPISERRKKQLLGLVVSLCTKTGLIHREKSGEEEKIAFCVCCLTLRPFRAPKKKGKKANGHATLTLTLS